MRKYYEIGAFKFKLEKTSSGYYELTTYFDGENWFTHMFSTLEQALVEILSYAEISEEDMEENERM